MRREGLGQNLPLPAEGYKCTTDDLLNVLLGVAANRGTIESVCSDLIGTPDAATIRGYFNEGLCVEDLPDLAQRLNAALADEIPWLIITVPFTPKRGAPPASS